MADTNVNPVLRLDRDALEQVQTWTVTHRGLEYVGEVIVAETVNPDWGLPLDGHTAFRIVLYTVPRRIATEQIRAPRIAMAVPRRAHDASLQSVGRELQAIREAKERYSAGGDADSRDILESMASQEASLQSDLARREAHSYSEGRIYTSSGLALSPTQMFIDMDPEAWGDKLVQTMYESAYPTLPLDHEALPSVLDSAAIADVFAGVVQGDREAAERVRGFGPALGISTSVAPDRFDPGGCEAMDIVAGAVERDGGETDAQGLMQLLSREYGLSREVATLYILAFVLHAQAEVSLTGRGATQLRDGGQMAGDLLTWDVEGDIRFSPEIADRLGPLRSRPQPSWNAALHYATAVDERLAPATHHADIAQQEERLIAALKGLGARLSAARERVAALGVPGDDVEDVFDGLDRLWRLSMATDYVEFLELARSDLGGPAGLRASLDSLVRVERLAELAPAIQSARLYAGRMAFGPGHGDLKLRRDSLASRAGLAELLANPSLWDSVEAGLHELRRDYSAAYTLHHTQYHDETAALTGRLRNLTPQVSALAKLNDVPDFGGPVGADVGPRFEDLADRVKTCTLGPADLDLADGPLCVDCSLSLDEEVPRRQAENVMSDLESALREYNRRLSSEAATQVLAHPTREQLDRLIDLVHISDLSALSNILDDRVVEFLRGFVNNAQPEKDAGR